MLSAIKKEVADRFEIPFERVGDTTHLRNDLNADSLDLSELLVAIEDRLSISIDDQTLELKNTPAEIAEHIMGCVGKAQE